jgi:NAD(P)-dependent dehydrogenase (short-subunit alcohol dehydrogenase family)
VTDGTAGEALAYRFMEEGRSACGAGGYAILLNNAPLAAFDPATERVTFDWPLIEQAGLIGPGNVTRSFAAILLAAREEGRRVIHQPGECPAPAGDVPDGEILNQ